MTLPYIPGWYDSLDKNALQGAMMNIGNAVAPDAMATQRLQALVAQNPMLLQQMANMDPAVQAQMQQTLGFKNKTPITTLPAGPERRERERVEQMRAAAMQDPTKAAEVEAQTLGILTPQQRKVNEQQATLNDLQIELSTGKVRDIQRAEKTLLDAQARYPDLDKVNNQKSVSDLIWKGKPLDASLVTAVRNNEGASTIFELTAKVELQKMADQARVRLASIKDPNESMLFLRGLTEYGNQLNDAQARLSTDINAVRGNLMLRMNPQVQADLKRKEAQLAELQTSAAENARIIGEYNKLIAGQKGINIPKQEETPEQRLARLKAAAGIR